MTIEVNEYNSECTRVVLHIYEGFTWYIITIIVPTLLLLYRYDLKLHHRGVI